MWLTPEQMMAREREHLAWLHARAFFEWNRCQCSANWEPYVNGPREQRVWVPVVRDIYGNLLQPILNPQHYGFGPGWVPCNPAGNPKFFGFIRHLNGNRIDLSRYSIALSPEVQAAWSQYVFTGPYRRP